MHREIQAPLRTFFAWLIALSAVGWTAVWVSGGYVLFTTALMWAPGVAALYVTRHRVGDVLGWRWPGSAMVLAGSAVPVLYASATYLALWGSRSIAFDGAAIGQLVSKMGLSTLPVPVGRATAVLVVGTIGLATYIVPALGEEIGWRGFLAPELSRRFGAVAGALATGVAWALWHYPLFAIGGALHEHAIRSLTCFTVMAVGISVPMTFLRVRTASLWPAVFFHAAHNLWLQRLLMPSVGEGHLNALLVDETGLGLAVAAAAVGSVFLVLWSLRLPYPDPPTQHAAGSS
jgi:membrane protease YdiL (CAAX protease family)